jgi:hypothetical protein
MCQAKPHSYFPSCPLLYCGESPHLRRGPDRVRRRLTAFPHRMSEPAAKPDPERRRNAALRELIDELLFRVRDANQHLDFWTPEERAKAEQELSTIMSRVRGAALHKSTSPS